MKVILLIRLPVQLLQPLLLLKQYSTMSDYQPYLMGHVPPIDDDDSQLYKPACYSQYMDLLGKYGYTVSGHFTGHTNSKY